MTAEPLDNAVWHAVHGPWRALAEFRPAAARFIPDVSLFAALPDEPDDAAWADLATLVGPDGVGLLFRRHVDVPPAWKVEMHLPGVQMVADGAKPRGDERLVPLGPEHVEEMLALVAATRPGPFGARTVEFGGYLGYRVDGRLVAMAGERLSTGDHTEISAVCTLPEYRGRGLGSALVIAVVDGIRSRGGEAMLHAATTNTTAIRLYEELGFVTRCEIVATLVRAPS